MAGDVRTPPSRPLPPLILRGERGRHLFNALNTYRTGEGQGGVRVRVIFFEIRLRSGICFCTNP